MVSGKTVLITGGSNGIGEAIGKKFQKEGAEVIVFDQEEPDYEARYFEVDIRNEEEIEEAISEINRVDILVNNAGVYRHTPIEEFSEQDFEDIFQTNVKGYRMMFTHTLPLLKKSEDGNVINISSGLAQRPEPYSDLYSASKAAINAMKTSWANSYAETGVRVNAILPGPVDTEMLTENFSEEELEEYKELQPMRKFSQPEDIAEAVVMLATNNSFNGAEIEIGGERHNNQYGL